MACQGILCDDGVFFLGLAKLDWNTLKQRLALASARRPLGLLVGPAGAAMSAQARSDAQSAVQTFISDFEKARSILRPLSIENRVAIAPLQTFFLKKTEIDGLTKVEGFDAFRTAIGDIVLAPELCKAESIECCVLETWLARSGGRQVLDVISTWTNEKVVIYLAHGANPVTESSSIDPSLIAYVQSQLNDQAMAEILVQALSSAEDTHRFRSFVHALVSMGQTRERAFVSSLISSQIASCHRGLGGGLGCLMIPLGLVAAALFRIFYWNMKPDDWTFVLVFMALLLLPIMIFIIVLGMKNYLKYRGFQRLNEES